MLVFAGFTLFAAWVVFRDGAERLEGSIASAFLINVLAPMLSASLLRAYVVLVWFAQLALLVFWLASD